MKKNRIAFAAVVVAALGVVGCSTTSDPTIATSTSSTSSAKDMPATGHNNADVKFAQLMIPHHAQAVQMSDIVLDISDVDVRVVTLARQIKDAQAPEIELMTGWLTEWGVEVPSPETPDTPGHGGGHGGGEGSADGMMSADDLTALAQAPGPEAGRLFLDQMIVHHQGAISMAETELSEGINVDAKKLAQQIIDAQQREIDQMRQMLAG